MFKLFKKQKQSQNSIYCIRYKIKGLNSETGRRKTAHLIVGSWEDLVRVLPRCGLLEPYEYERDNKPPTERQLQYARSIKLSLPQNCTLEDASILLSRYENDVPLNLQIAPVSFFEYAVENNVFLPSLISKKEAQEYLLNVLPSQATEIYNLNN